MNNAYETRRVILQHAEKYPLMQPRDAVKLVFQNEFGGGHLIKDASQSLERLKTESASLSYNLPACELCESIGNGLVRVQLAACEKAGMPLEALNDAFVKSALLYKGSRQSFDEKLALLKEVVVDGAFCFGADEFSVFLDAYRKDDCPAVSHSELYRCTYFPAYRVVQRQLIEKYLKR